MHGYAHIQCNNGKWEKYVPKRSTTSFDIFEDFEVIDMDIDLVEPICIDHCPCKEANACQSMPLSMAKSTAMKLSCSGKGEKLQIQGAVYGRWNSEQCSSDIYMKPEFLPPALFGGRCQSENVFERTKRVCNGKSDCVFNTKGIQNDCPETRKQLRVCYSCNEKEACWSQWSNWSECSKECDGGVRSRQRICVRTGKQSHCTGKMKFN